MDPIAQADGNGRDLVEALCAAAFGPDGPQVAGLTDLNRGRGAFSVVVRVELAWEDPQPVGPPATVVAKLPVGGPNGEAARRMGAYRREALAYREVLTSSPVAHPRAHSVLIDDDDGASFLLEDLTDRRLTDQLDGLADTDAVAVAEALARFHRAWASSDRLARLPVRRNTLAALAPDALEAGLRALDERWHQVLGPDDRAVLTGLVKAHHGLVERFDDEPATLCHGDPRADNLAFERSDGRPILFDWQQMAAQFGEADLAWLAATSLTIADRRRIEAELVTAGGGDRDRYRLGLALPGLAVLFLAQRELPTERSRRLVAESLRRIAAAVADNETAALGHR